MKKVIEFIGKNKLNNNKQYFEVDKESFELLTNTIVKEKANTYQYSPFNVLENDKQYKVRLILEEIR